MCKSIAFVLSALSAVIIVAAAAQEVQFRSEVRLVTVLATVRDAGGKLVPALGKDDFEVLDEGVAQPIRVFARESDVPLSIALLLDASLSTAKDLKFEQEAATRFVRSILRAEDRASLFAVTHDVVQMAPFTNSMSQLERAIRAVKPVGGTSLYDAIYLASDELEHQEGRRRVIVAITDGGDTTSTTTFHRALRAAQTSGVALYSVVVVPIRSEAGRNIGGEHALELLSGGTGGRAIYADSAVQLDPAFAAVADELRAHYLLGFYASQQIEPGVFRRIEVRVKHRNFAVRARKGYYLQEH